MEEEPQKAGKPITLILANDGIAILGTLLWIGCTYLEDLPLVFFPLLTATGMGFALRNLSGGGEGRRLMIYSGIIAFLTSLVGNVFTTILLASAGEETSTSLQDLVEFLQVPSQLGNVIRASMTPMDLLMIYMFPPFLAAMLAKGPLFQPEYEPPAAEQIPMATAIPDDHEAIPDDALEDLDE